MSYLAKNYNRKKISFTKGKGSYLYTSKGVKYLDFVQGIAKQYKINPKNFGIFQMLLKFLRGKS